MRVDEMVTQASKLSANREAYTVSISLGRVSDYDEQVLVRFSAGMDYDDTYPIPKQASIHVTRLVDKKAPKSDT